jgi:alcohol dehydrogenase
LLLVDRRKAGGGIMKALVYHGPGARRWEDRPSPKIQEREDAIVKIVKTTLCGTDLHILAGEVPSVADGRVLGHEGVGVIDAVGEGVRDFQSGDRVVLSCITSCARCPACRRAMYSHCERGGWILGNTIDGTQAEYVRVPYADTSLYRVPKGIDEEAMVMLSDILPTALECGIRNGEARLGERLAIVGAGPVGLAALLTARLYSLAQTIVVDVDDHRLEVAKSLGATDVVSTRDGQAVERVSHLTQKKGVDVAIEAVGLPVTFDICQRIVAPGGRIANIGVHGRPVELALHRLWSHNITLRTALVDTSTIPVLMTLVQAGWLEPAQLITHRFTLGDIEKAYDTFENAAQKRALKVILMNE